MKLVWVEDCSEEVGNDSLVAFTVFAFGFWALFPNVFTGLFMAKEELETPF
jgi:hypothetical protein